MQIWSNSLDIFVVHKSRNCLKFDQVKASVLAQYFRNPLEHSLPYYICKTFFENCLHHTYRTKWAKVSTTNMNGIFIKPKHSDKRKSHLSTEKANKLHIGKKFRFQVKNRIKIRGSKISFESFTSLKADLHQYLKGCLAFIKCLNGMFPLRKYW